MRHLPFYGRWFRFLMTFPGIARGWSSTASTPTTKTARVMESTRSTRSAATCCAAWMRSVLAERPDLIEKSTPDYPPMGKRVLQDNGSWLRCLAKPNVELIRTGIERIVPEGVVTVDGVVHPVDVICYATGFRHSDFLATIELTGRDGVSLREQWGDEPTAYLGITMHELPEPVLHVRAGYEPGGGRGPVLPLRIPDSLRDRRHASRPVLAAPARSRSPKTPTPNTPSATSGRSVSWSGRIRPSPTATTRSPQGKVYTLSPWPLDQYWGWTRAVEPADYLVT